MPALEQNLALNHCVMTLVRVPTEFGIHHRLESCGHGIVNNYKTDTNSTSFALPQYIYEQEEF